MKMPLSLLSLALFVATHAASAASPTIPQRPPPDAFQKLTEDWPFALATPAAPVAEVVKGWASNFYIGGIGKKSENGQEEVYVAVKSKDGQPAFSLFGNQPNGEDISVHKIEWSDDPLKSKVVLKKGNEFQTIEPDQAAQAPSPQTPATPRPGMPIPQGGRVQPNRPPGIAVPRPTNIPQGIPQGVPAAPQVPMPSNTNIAPPVPVPGTNPANPAPRQRVRVITSTPQ